MRFPSVVRPLFIVTALAVLLAGLRFSAPLLIPLLMSAFAASLLFPVYNGLLRRKVPAAVALLLTAALLVAVVFFLVWLVGYSVAAMMASLDGLDAQLAQRQSELEAGAAALGQSAAFQQALSGVSPGALQGFLKGTLDVVASIAKQSLIVLVVTAFLLAEGSQFRARLASVFGVDHIVTWKTLTLVRIFIRYFGLRTIVNLITGAGMTVILWLMGIPNALLWGVLMFFMSYIPYIGIMIAVAPPLILAYAEYGVGMAVLLIVLTIVVNATAENIVSPIIMGKGLSVSPTVVFLAFIFWMWLLGGTAALIAMPLTMAVLMILASFEETRRWVAIVATIPLPMDTGSQAATDSQAV